MKRDTDLLTPFTGERFAALDRLSSLISPPYDVISPQERAELAARDPHNIVHLILPEGEDGDRYAHAADLLRQWRRDGVLVRDRDEAVYVVAQRFKLPTGEQRTRAGMFAALLAEPYETGRVRPHERTHAGPKADRLALMRATNANLESIFVLAPDADKALADRLGAIARRPADARAELDGTEMTVWTVRGGEAAELATLASRDPVYMADGHHRYETAVAFARERPEADRLLSFVVSAHDPGLAVLPTHRVIYGAGRDPEGLVEQWRAWFDVGRVAPCADRMERLAQLGRNSTACLVATPNADDLSLVLRPGVPLDRVEDLGRSEAVKALDLARVEALVVRPILRAGTGTPNVSYTPDARQAFDAVRKGGAAAAVLLNPTRVEQVFAVADARDVMPPKSTYFVPKVPAGIVMRDMSDGRTVGRSDG